MQNGAVGAADQSLVEEGLAPIAAGLDFGDGPAEPEADGPLRIRVRQSADAFGHGPLLRGGHRQAVEDDGRIVAAHRPSHPRQIPLDPAQIASDRVKQESQQQQHREIRKRGMMQTVNRSWVLSGSETINSWKIMTNCGKIFRPRIA